MADIDNIAEINENFDTVKTLLNSIRAQGILNTSDVDKLLSGINAKLEKINTEEDIDLIKVFLTELKQNLDERHNVLVSKFGAIESLFTNLLKNSNELPKSSDVKEYFDIVATNLSVFSREVVAQKESLTDITLRLDAIRSDDSQKKDIIKNITLLKPDLERLNNGFDTIVISLNDNFKTLAKTISAIDQTEHLNKFADELNNIEMSSNTILSALQFLDKKTVAVDDSIKNLATKADLDETGRNINELRNISQSVKNEISEISGRYAKIDDLAEKIDASVNIIASLKSVLEDADNQNAKNILEQIEGLGAKLNEINDDTKFNEFKESLTVALREISENAILLDKNVNTTSENITSIFEMLRAIDINTNFSSVLTALESGEDKIKTHIDEKIQTFTTVSESNLGKILENISVNADSLNSRINQTQSEIASICEGNFGTVFANITDLKRVVEQLEEDGVSANNAMFSNISDRLALFETALKESLEAQENTTNNASEKLNEQVENIKNLSNVLDYKMDTSVVEISNMTRMFETLKNSVDGVLALNFVETVKDLRADIYASKQDLSLAVEASGNALSENMSNDLYGKYELLISKLDYIEDEFKKTQTASLTSIKETMEKISSSIVDIISYVSEAKEFPTEEIDKKIDKISETLKGENLNYVENVRDIVDVIRVQVENNLKSLEEDSSKRFDYLNRTLENNNESIHSNLQNTYDKIVEIQNLYNELKEALNVNGLDNSTAFDKLFTNVSGINTEFETKINALKNALLDKVSEFKNELACDNADKVNEFKFTVENLFNKNSQDITDLLDGIKVQLDNFALKNGTDRTEALGNITNNLDEIKSLVSVYSTESAEKREEALGNIYGNFENIKTIINDLSNDVHSGREAGLNKLMERINALEEQVKSVSEDNKSAEELTISKLSENHEELREKLDKLTDENSDSRTNALAKLLENFVGLKEYAQSLNNRTSEELTQKTNSILESFNSVKTILKKVDENVDGDMTRQLSIIESNFESLISQMNILNEKAEQSFVEMINEEYTNISQKIDDNVTLKLEEYKSMIESTFDELSDKAETQSVYLQERVSEINSVMKSVWEAQAENNKKQIDEIAENLKEILNRNVDQASVDYAALRERLDEFTKDLSDNNEVLTQNLKAQLDDMTKYIDSVIDIQTQESDAHIDEFIKLIEVLSEKNQEASNKLAELNNRISVNVENTWSKMDDIKLNIEEKSDEFKELFNKLSNNIAEKSSGTQALITNLSDLVQENTDSIGRITAETSAAELKAIEDSADKLLEQLEIGKQAIESIKTFISSAMQMKLKDISGEIEKETDVILAELTSQFENMRKSQQDVAIQITSGIESIVENQIYNNIEDLKSYLDIKTDNSALSEKLDNLKLDVTASFENVISDMNKMLQADVFTSAISDYRMANEILINSATDRINGEIADFVGNVSKQYTEALGTSSEQVSEAIADATKNIENKLALFDKKFIDAVVDKYEEIKLLSNKYNGSFDEIEKSIGDIISDFKSAKDDIHSRIDDLTEAFKITAQSTNSEILKLVNSFEGLRSQISNKSFDEAFQASINKQIGSLEKLIKEQYNCIDDISDMCGTNLPDVAELNTLVKGSVMESLKDISRKLDGVDSTLEAQDIKSYVENVLKSAKTDIITQFLNIFNQISFVAEQEEILDYIQERHDELVTILSHIVTSTSDIKYVKEKTAAIDSKIGAVKNELSSINDKITSIISSDGDVDYIYSLQDLESDIANLRIVLKDMKDNTAGYSTEFNNLLTSTENVYKLVESIKDELPDKKSLESISEDIVSISTRTNKLILASDESYKTLQDNLNDFKLIIDDLDERTRNFAQESGMDRVDAKLNALNTMAQNGAKTNQIFNQVFEYLAEWVDNAGNQISAISDKVETLDDIGQIKVMLADLKAEAEDNSQNVELIQALGDVFDKQAKKITALETKLDKIIVETTVYNKKNKFDLSPMEDTLNKFLEAIGDKMTSQQDKIDLLEAKLEKVVDILDEKDTTQLSKKMGGMDKQIAKLNKSIEKIASHVIEK